MKKRTIDQRIDRAAKRCHLLPIATQRDKLLYDWFSFGFRKGATSQRRKFK